MLVNKCDVNGNIVCSEDYIWFNKMTIVSDVYNILKNSGVGKVQKTNIYTGNKTFYFNDFCTLDIETSELKDDPFNTQVIITWQFCFFGYKTVCGIGKNQLLDFLKVLKGKRTHLLENMDGGERGYAKLARLKDTSYPAFTIYIHNMVYDWTFFKEDFEWNTSESFAIGETKIYKMRTDNLIFLNSKFLLNGSLEEVTKNVCHKKKVGNWDYNKVRATETGTLDLSDEETEYMLWDVWGLYEAIKTKCKQYDNVYDIPLTFTGACKEYYYNFINDPNNCNQDGQYEEYNYDQWWRNHIANYVFEEEAGRTYSKCKVRDEAIDWYLRLRVLYCGGFCEPCFNYTNEIIKNVAHVDASSYYLLHMIIGKFPYTWHYCNVNKIDFNNKDRDFLVRVRFKELKSKRPFGSLPIKTNLYHDTSQFKFMNHKIIYAPYYETYINQDRLEEINLVYDYKEMEIVEDRAMECKLGYLPIKIRKAIIKAFENKTKLKGIKGQEFEYANAKVVGSSSYGMAATNPVRDEWKIDSNGNVIKKESKDNDLVKIRKSLKTFYRQSRHRILSYDVGVYISQKARTMLIRLICKLQEMGGKITVFREACGDTGKIYIEKTKYGLYITSDTDSIFFVDCSEARDAIKEMNDLIIEELKKTGLPFCFKNQKGEDCYLGVFESEDDIDIFRCNGSKFYIKGFEGRKMMDHNLGLCYSKRDNMTYQITVAGLPKKKAVRHYIRIGKQRKHNVCIMFNSLEKVPKKYSDKKNVTYYDYKTIRGKNDPQDNIVTVFGERTKQNNWVKIEETEYSPLTDIDVETFINYMEMSGDFDIQKRLFELENMLLKKFMRQNNVAEDDIKTIQTAKQKIHKELLKLSKAAENKDDDDCQKENNYEKN